MREGELASLQRWRLAAFIELGYTPEEAIELAYAGLDVHDVDDLIAKGCPPSLARKILE